jgi:hypothetical protein
MWPPNRESKREVVHTLCMSLWKPDRNGSLDALMRTQLAFDQGGNRTAPVQRAVHPWAGDVPQVSDNLWRMTAL